MKPRIPALFPLLLLLAPPAAAQDPPSRAAAAEPSCDTGAISVIFFDTHSIFDTADPELDPRFGWAYRAANALHVRTRASVIERELLFRVGDCFDPVLLEDSERLLRRYAFLSRVDLFGVRQPDGSHHVIVDTQDEWSTRVDLRVRLEDGVSLEGVRLRELNLLGTGRTIELFYTERDANRDYGIAYETPQLAGTRWDLRTAAGRTRAGSFLRQSLAYPFVGETGRWAAQQSLRWQDRYFDYVIGDPDTPARLLLPVRDKGFELAVVRRTGKVGRTAAFGAGIGIAELSYPAPLELVSGGDYDDRRPPDSAHVAAVRPQLHRVSTARLLLLVGRRSIGWVKRRGLDSFRGEQDVRLGSEVEMTLGGSLPGRRSDNRLFTALRIYGGAESGDLLVAGQLRADARRDLDAPVDRSAWEDIFADAELLAYWRPAEGRRHTVVLRAAGAGGWQSRTPFQLTLGGDLALRGYERERFPGGRRLIFSLEDRIYFGWPLREVVDLGGTIFADVGRIWPGDAPFGTDSGWRAALGAGLRGTFPAGGRTTYRVDLAHPLGNGIGWENVRVIVTIGEPNGLLSGQRSARLRQRRPLPVADDLFHFPE